MINMVFNISQCGIHFDMCKQQYFHTWLYKPNEKSNLFVVSIMLLKGLWWFRTKIQWLLETLLQ